jgi:hypothetical protein
LEGMANSDEPRINAVIANKPKRLKGLDQKGRWSGRGAPNSPLADAAPPAERGGLIPSRNGTHVERGKPDGLYKAVESDPQGAPIGQRVRDTGASEGRLVMRRIGRMPNPKGCPLPAGKDSREGWERQHDLASTGQ